MDNFIELFNSYKTAIGRMTVDDAKTIVQSYGNYALSTFRDLPEDGEGIMTKGLLAKRKLACSECPVRNGNTCVTTRTREHKTLKNDDGTPRIVSGCGCNLAAKQYNIGNSCPAGEW